MGRTEFFQKNNPRTPFRIRGLFLFTLRIYHPFYSSLSSVYLTPSPLGILLFSRFVFNKTPFAGALRFKAKLSFRQRHRYTLLLAGLLRLPWDYRTTHLFYAYHRRVFEPSTRRTQPVSVSRLKWILRCHRSVPSFLHLQYSIPQGLLQYGRLQQLSALFL